MVQVAFSYVPCWLYWPPLYLPAPVESPVKQPVPGFAICTVFPIRRIAIRSRSDDFQSVDPAGIAIGCGVADVEGFDVGVGLAGAVGVGGEVMGADEVPGGEDVVLDCAAGVEVRENMASPPAVRTATATKAAATQGQRTGLLTPTGGGALGRSGSPSGAATASSELTPLASASSGDPHELQNFCSVPVRLPHWPQNAGGGPLRSDM